MRAAPRLRIPLAVAVALIGFVCLLSPSALADPTSSNAYAQLVQGDSPLAYWRLDGTSTATADATGNGHTLQWVDPRGNGRTPTLGAQAIPALQPDTAVQLDGADSAPYGEYQEPAGQYGSLNPKTISVEAWVKPMDYLPPSGSDGNTREAIISSYSGCESAGCELGGYQLYNSNYSNWGDHPQFAFSTADDLPTGNYEKNWVVDTQDTLKTDTWYHVVATATPRTNGEVEMHLYVNGKDVTTCPRGGTSYPNKSGEPTYLGLGTREDVKTYRFNGEMDEVAVYDHVLAAGRVLAHYNAGTAEQPTVTLENANGSSFRTGGTAHLAVSVGNVSGAIDAQLTAKVTGTKSRTIQVPINGTTGDFYYSSTKSGTDTVKVSGTIDGQEVTSNPVKIHWLAGANSTEGSFGVTGSSVVARSAHASLADPIDSDTGNFYQSVTDVSVPGTGTPFSITRTYNSLDESTGAMGRGWSANLFSSLQVDDAGNVTLNTGDGQEIGYILEPDGSYQGDKNVTAVLTKTGSGYDLVEKSEDIRHFDSDGRIVSWLDSNGQGLRFSHNSNGQLTSATDSADREYDLSYNGAGHLTGVSLPDGTSLSYGYDGSLLTSFTDQTGAVTKYAYDQNGFLESTTDGSGKLLFQNAYDDQGRITSQTDASGNTNTFKWSDGGGVTATDAQNGSWQDAYNNQGQIQTRTDALGNVTNYVYDDANDLNSETNPLGNTTTYTYDERENMLTKTDALGNTESWTYDQDNNVLTHTDQLGNTTTYTYDDPNGSICSGGNSNSEGNLCSETDPLGNTTSYTYDSAGRQIASTDPLRRTTKSVYDDDQGNLIATISPSGAKTTYTYDSLSRQISTTNSLGYMSTTTYDDAGRVVKTTDALGNSTTSSYDDAGRLVAKTDAKGNTTQYVYDADGRQVKVINPDGSTTESEYDADDNLIASTDALGNVTKYAYDADGRQIAKISPSGATAKKTYDAAGNTVSTTDPLGRETTSKYDADGRQIESTDPMGRTTKTVYDADGNVAKKIDALGNVTRSVYDADGNVIETIDPLGHTTKSVYDAAGQFVSETDANGNVTLHSYNQDGNEIQTTDPSGGVTKFAYDADGKKLSETDPLGHTTTYAYDADDNQISKTNPLGEKTTYAYDADGNQIAETDPNGNVSKTRYDSMNRRIEQTDPLGNVTKTAYDLNGDVISTTDALGNTTTSTYDPDGNLVKTTDPLGEKTTYAYDAGGEQVSKTDANGHVTTYAYDAGGEKTQVTAPDGSITPYAYDSDGNVVKRTDANAHSTTYAYDAAGNKVSKTDPLGRTWHYAYDGNGNLVETKAPAGGTITESYDSQDRPVKKSYSDGTPYVSYAYDKAGNKTQMVDGTGKTTYAYDAAGERIGALRTDGSFLYSYDSDGNILSRTYPNGLKTSYTYNQASEMTTAKVGNGKTYYTYDPNGKLVSTLNANGILENRTYDAAGHLTDISGQDPKGRPLYSRSYAYDPVGNPLTLVATAPRDHSPGWWGMLWRHRGAELTKWTETYSYDSRDRLVKACMNEWCSRYLAYSYDPVGNRVKLETREGATTYTYDAADELLSTSKHCRRDVITYAYDRNGNEVKEGLTVYSYNLENELIEAKDGPSQVSYTYTGDGLMATRSTRQEMTSYSWDTNSDLPQLAVETDSKGQGRFQVKDSRSYTYGEAPLGIVHGRDTLTFHTDAIGSVVELSDDHGQIADSYRYTPFGESYGPGESDEAPAETSENQMRFAGQYLDSESGLYDMRAREYDPEIGRFLEEDPLEADAGESAVGVYVYVGDQPTVMTDASGDHGIPVSGGLAENYDRDAALNWAMHPNHWDNIASDWPSLEGCTNYVSYALRAGGFQRTPKWHQGGSWAGLRTSSPTGTWDNAQLFWEYWRHAPGVSSYPCYPHKNGKYDPGCGIFQAETGDAIVMQTKSDSDYTHTVLVSQHTPGSHSQISVIKNHDGTSPYRFPLLDRVNLGASTYSRTMGTSEDDAKYDPNQRNGKWPKIGLLHFTITY